jgi:hypothetical protein
MADNNFITPASGTGQATYVTRMKDIFLPQLNNFWAGYDDEVIGVIGKNKGNKLDGKRSVTVAGVGMSVGAGSGGETQRLPTPTATSSIELELRDRKYNARLAFTPEVLLHARGGDSSWQDSYSFEMESLMDFITIDKNDAANIGRSRVIGRHAAAPTAAGVVQIQAITNRGANADRYFDRGMLDNVAGTEASFPFYRKRRLSFINSALGSMGAPFTGSTAPSGDRTAVGATNGGPSGTTSDNNPIDEVYVEAINGSDYTAQTVTYNQNNAALPGSAAAFIALTNMATAFIIPYGSRAPTMSGNAANDTTRFYGMEGIQSYLSNPSYAYSAILGQSKTAASGLQAFFDTNPVAAGTDRVFSDRILAHAQRSIRRRTNGKGPKLALCTWPGWDQVANEHENLKRIEAVVGNGGTTAYGNTPDGYSYIGGGGQIMFKPLITAMPKQMALLDPADWEYMQTKPFGLIDPLGHMREIDYDLSQYAFQEFGNYMCSHIMGQGIIDDLAENPFAIAV